MNNCLLWRLLNYIVVAYIVFVWIILRIIVPHLGFIKKPIPAQISPELDSKINELKLLSKNNKEFLEHAYNYVTQKYYGRRMRTLIEVDKAFGDILNKPAGFLPCTGQNYLLRTMLVKSSYFTDSDIKVHTVFFNFFIHQYLSVKIDGKWIDVEPWSHFKGLQIGQKSFLFG